MKKIEQNKILCSEWFQRLRKTICEEIEKLEDSNCKFSKKMVERPKRFRKYGWWRNEHTKRKYL